MKITVLSEGYIKTVDKMKAKAEDRLTADDIRREAKKIVVTPVLENEEFLLKCGNCFKTFIHVNANTTPPGVLNFRYVNLKDGVLTVDCDAHYTGNLSQRNHATAKSVLIEDDIIAKYSVEEMNKEIDDYVTKYLWQYFKKRQPEILEHVERIHIERIYLWSNTPESVNGVFPGKLSVRIKSEYYGQKILTESEVSDLFDKINQLFEFCAQDVLLEKTEIKMNHNVKGLADVANLLDINNNPRPKQSSVKYSGVSYQMNDHFDKLTLTALQRKDLSEFIPISIDEKIDLRKYILSHDLEGSVVKRDARPWINGARVITTANQKEIDSIKDQLMCILHNGNTSDMYRNAQGRILPDPKSGFIEYLAYACEYKSDFYGYNYDTVLDYIDGEFHDFYRIAIE